MSDRLKHLRRRLQELEMEGMIVTQAQNRRYLSRFSGSAGWLLVTASDALLFTDSRYWEQVRRECADFELIKLDNQLDHPYLTALQEQARRLGLGGPLGFESDDVSYAQHQQMEKAWSGLRLRATSGLVEELRLIKEPDEVEWMRQAAHIADEALEAIMPQVKAGTSERELAAALQYQMKLRGAEKESFDTIVASGPNGALPHAKPGERALADHDMVTVDFGATVAGYNSDMTRTVAVGSVSGKMADIYRLVRRAQQTALEALRPGLTCGQADAIARDIIEQAGYGPLFGHSLGHGVGLAVHESPRLRRNDTTVLAPGMVVTVEPGVYVPDLGGVRIEDMAVITSDGYDVLTRAPKCNL